MLYPSWQWRLAPQVYSSPSAVTAAVWCFAADTDTTTCRARDATGRGTMVALSPLWMSKSPWPAGQCRLAALAKACFISSVLDVMGAGAWDGCRILSLQ